MLSLQTHSVWHSTLDTTERSSKRPPEAVPDEHAAQRQHKRQAVGSQAHGTRSPSSASVGPAATPLGAPALAPSAEVARQPSFEFMPSNSAATASASFASDRGCDEWGAPTPTCILRGTSEVTLGLLSAYPHPGCHDYVEAPTAELSLRAQPLWQQPERTWSLGNALPVAEPVLPQPAPDPDSNVFKPEPLLHLNGQAMQHLAILKEMRTKVANALKHRISRRVSAGKLSAQAAEAMQKAINSRLVKPVSLALQRYCAAKRYFAESQACLSHIDLNEGFGALGLFNKDVTTLTESLANAIAKAAVQAEASFVEQRQQQVQVQALKDPKWAVAGPDTAPNDDHMWQLEGASADAKNPEATLSLSKLVCRRPPVEAPHRSSFCGPRNAPPSTAALAGSSPAARICEMPAMLALPSTPRSADAAAQRSPGPLSLTPCGPVGVQRGAAEGHGAAHEHVAGESLVLEQQQSRADGALAILRPRSGSSSGGAQWSTPASGQPGSAQPPALCMPPSDDGLAAHHAEGEHDLTSHRHVDASQEGHAEVGDTPGTSTGAAAVAGPASTVISCVSPSAHLHNSSADSPHRAPVNRQALGDHWGWEHACQQEGAATVQGQGHAESNGQGEGGAAAATATAAESLTGREASFAPAALDAFCDVALASGQGCIEPVPGGALEVRAGDALQVYCSVASARDRRESCATVSSHAGPSAGTGEPAVSQVIAAAPAAARCVSEEAVLNSIACSDAGAENGVVVAGPAVKGSGAGAEDAEVGADTGLALALATTFMQGLEAVDWYAVVQDAYGVDPEELLLQQKGLEEGQEEEEQEEQVAWTRNSIQGSHRH